jgi:hypothetical protein
MHNTAVAVWSFNHQRFVYFIPCPGEKRVRIDVHDGVHNYAVYPAIYHDNGTFDVTSDEALADWTISLS